MNHIPIYPMTGGIAVDTQRTASLESAPVRLSQQPDHLLIPLKHKYVRYRSCVSIGDHIQARQAIAVSIDSSLKQQIHSHFSGQVIDISPEQVIIQTAVETSEPSLENPKCESFSDLCVLLGRYGITGLGGAEFPTQKKMSQRTHTLLVNGVECEPLLTSDACLMTHDPETIIQGIDILQQFLPLNRILWAIESDKPLAIKKVQQSIHSNIQLITIPSQYPAGGSRQLYEQIFGSRLAPDEHLLNQGVLCLNVQTIAAIANAFKGQPLTQRIVTITGTAVKQPKNIWLALGTPLSWIQNQIELMSGDLQIIFGGPLMGEVISNREMSVTSGTSAIIFNIRENKPKEIACIQCGYCNIPCPEVLQPQALIRYAKETQADQTDYLQQLNIMDCIECGACDLVCPSHIPLSRIFKTKKQIIRRQNEQQIRANHARLKYEARLERLNKPARANPLPPAPKRQEYKSTKSKAQLKTALAKAQRLARESVAALQQAEKKQLDDATLATYRDRVAQMQTKALEAQKAYEASV